MAHPVRLRIMSLLTGASLTAAEVARELGITHANASYHLRSLASAGMIVPAGEERIRGGVAKRYRYPHELRGLHPNRTRPSLDDQTLYVRAVGQEVERRMRLRGSGRTTSSDLEGWVPPEVWERACALLTEASHLLHDHNAAPRTPGTVHISATTWAFPMQDSQQDQS